MLFKVAVLLLANIVKTFVELLLLLVAADELINEEGKLVSTDEDLLDVVAKNRVGSFRFELADVTEAGCTPADDADDDEVLVENMGKFA